MIERGTKLLAPARTKVSNLQGRTEASIAEKMPQTAESRFAEQLLHALGCLKALNFRQIAFLGRELDEIPQDKADRILWHEEAAQSENAFAKLQKLCAKGLVLPWRSWGPDEILLNTKGPAQPQKTGVFYLLGRKGYPYLKEHYSFMPNPAIVEELYINALPLSRWLTASTCALALQTEGYKLTSSGMVWKERADTPAPAFRPDFIVVKDRPMAFYIFDSPFALRSQCFVAHVGRGLHRMSRDSDAVILVRTKEAFTRIFVEMQGVCLGENRERVFVGDLWAFRNRHGHTYCANAKSEQILL